MDEISSKNGIDSKKQGSYALYAGRARLVLTILFTARLLRYLATKLVFREVRPDTFANNRISSVFDTGKSTDTLRLRYVPYDHRGANIPNTSHSPTERNVGFNAIINHGLVPTMLA